MKNKKREIDEELHETKSGRERKNNTGDRSA
jgi:hypothetical protein